MLVSWTAPRRLLRLWFVGALLMLASFSGRTEEAPLVRQEVYQVTPRSLPLTRLDDQATQAIEAHSSLAIIHRGQSLALLRPGMRHVETLAPLPNHPNPEFGPLCRAGEGFLVSLRTPPTPGPQGWYYLSDRKTAKTGAHPEIRFIETLRITTRPRAVEMPFSYQGPTLIRGPMTTCSWGEQGLYLAMPGALGRANLSRRTIDFLDVDDPAATIALRGPIMTDGDAVWVGIDEGSAGQTRLQWLGPQGRSKSWILAESEDPMAISALVRHQGQIYLGTSHGLFRFDEAKGRFIYQDLGNGAPGTHINALYSDSNALWVFGEGQWFHLNTGAKTGTRFVLQPTTPLVTGVPFENYWLVGGPEGVWRTPALIKTSERPKLSSPPTTNKQPSPRRLSGA
jgi:hypothetical protein